MSTYVANKVRDALPYYGTKQVLVPDQDTNDIVDYIVQLHPKIAPQYNQVADLHWRGDVESTGRHLFQFLKHNVIYDVEPPDDQTIKKPGAIVWEGYGDCKHYASYIVGVCDSLRRQGFPIRAKYRFTADRPDMPVHHVFAVISDGKKEFWVDPVVDRFNKRPVYYNIKDKDMALSLISGTDEAIGKKHRNIFKELKHGVDVAVHDTKKGIENTAKKIKATALKLMPATVVARNSFLSLVDFNIINLAKHLHATINSPKKDELFRAWRDLGGNPSKLQAAVHNGIKWYNKHHAHKISGMQLEDAINHYQAHAWPWHPSHIPHRMRGGHRVYLMRGMHIGCSCQNTSMGCIGCEANAIGCLPACAPAIIALATAIIAALKPYLHLSPQEDAALTAHAKQGVADLVDSSAAGIDIANGEHGPAAADAMNSLVKPGANAPSMTVSTGTDEDGTPTLRVHDVDHPVINKAGAPMTADDDRGGDNPNMKEHGIMDDLKEGFSNFVGHVKQFVGDYKVPLGFAAAGVVTYKVATRKRKGRRK